MVGLQEGRAHQARPAAGADQGRAGPARSHGRPRSTSSPSPPRTPAGPAGKSAGPTGRSTSARGGPASPATRGRHRQGGARSLAMAHHAHGLDRARREGLRGVRAEDRRERLPQHARLPRRRPVQSAVSRLQPARHALLRRLRRSALHAARLLRLEERAALLLCDGCHAARALPATSATRRAATPSPAAAISSMRPSMRARPCR